MPKMLIDLRPAASYLQVPPVDLVDDLQVTRQQVLEEVDGPALQGFRQDGVVGVGTGTDHDVPGLDTERTGPSNIITSTRIFLTQQLKL